MDKNITYEQIFHATSNGVVITDASGNIVYINQRAEKILDLRAKKHAGIYISKLLPLTGPQVMECLRTGRSKLGHHIIGKKVDLVLNITLIRSRKQIKGAVCNFQELKQFESSAKKLESYRCLNRQLETIL